MMNAALKTPQAKAPKTLIVGLGKTGLSVARYLRAQGIPVAVTAILRPFGPYLYRAYEHPCPWCLFLPKNRLVGYLLLGALIVVALEACACFICSWVEATSPALKSGARSRSRMAGLRMALAAIFFLALVGIPAIL